MASLRNILRVAGLLILVALIDASAPLRDRTVLRLTGEFPDDLSERQGEYLAQPYDADVHDGLFYVSDTNEGTIKVFSAEGKLIRRIGSRGIGPGELSEPYALAVDPTDGTICCYDGGGRISRFSREGRFLGAVKPGAGAWDLVSSGGVVFVSAFSDAHQSFLAAYDRRGTILNRFGTCFDQRVNQMPYDYKSMLYENAELDISDGRLFVFFERLPFIQVYGLDGKLIETIRLNDARIQKLYRKNLSAKPKGSRMGIFSWLAGAQIEGGSFYCFSPGEIGGIGVFNQQGDLIKTYVFDGIDPSSLIQYTFIKKVGNDFIFIDHENGKIKKFSL